MEVFIILGAAFLFFAVFLGFTTLVSLKTYDDIAVYTNRDILGCVVGLLVFIAGIFPSLMGSFLIADVLLKFFFPPSD